MYTRLLLVLGLALLPWSPSLAQQTDAYDYHGPTRMLIQRGTQALMMCNGLFVSNRTLDQVYEQELQYYRMPALPPYGGQVTIDEERQGVVVGGASNDAVPAMRAVARPGLGCIILPPDQTLADAEALPQLTLPPPPDASQVPWPQGDLIPETALPAEIDAEALAAASDWTFDRTTHGHPSQVTLSLIVVHRGQIVHERYAPGVDYTTRTRTWSTAKSIAATLIGLQVDAGTLDLDAPLGFDWLPEAPHAEHDPRQAITLRHALHMASGLQAIDNRGLCEVRGSCLSYWAGTSSV
ncbi:MAG: serine hydrolase domain-containing protein, partial [Bacteroidota bacterium]